MIEIGLQLSPNAVVTIAAGNRQSRKRRVIIRIPWLTLFLFTGNERRPSRFFDRFLHRSSMRAVADKQRRSFLHTYVR